MFDSTACEWGGMTRPTAGSVESRPASSRMVMGDNKMTWQSICLNLMTNALSRRMMQGDTATGRWETTAYRMMLGDTALGRRSPLGDNT